MGDLSKLNEHQRAAWAKSQRNARATISAGDHVLQQHGPECDEHELDRARAEAFDAVRDVLWRLTSYGSDDEGFVSHYLVSSGTVHRLVGAMIAAGESAPLRNPEPVGGDDTPQPATRDKRKEGCYGCTASDPESCATNCDDAQRTVIFDPPAASSVSGDRPTCDGDDPLLRAMLDDGIIAGPGCPTTGDDE